MPQNHDLYQAGFRTKITRRGSPKQSFESLKKDILGLIKNGLIRKDAVQFTEQEILFKYAFEEMKAFLRENNVNVLMKKCGSFEDSIWGSFWTLNNVMQDQNVDILLKEAEAYLKSVSPKFTPLTNFAMPKKALSLQGQEAILEGLFKDHQGLTIGEAHTHQSSKQFLMNHAKKLKSLDVEVLFLEHFSEGLQPSLNEFFKTGIMPCDLKCYVKALDKKYNIADKDYNFMNILKCIQASGIQPIAIETTYSYSITGALESNGHDRMLALNYLFAQHVKTLQQKRPKAKWIAFNGFCHATTSENVPGFAEITGNPSIIIIDTGADKKQKMKVNHQARIGKEEAAANIFLILDINKNKFLQSKQAELDEPNMDFQVDRKRLKSEEDNEI